MTTNAAPPASPAALRVRVFVDFWNFQLAMNDAFGKNFQIDWKALGPWLAETATQLISSSAGSLPSARYEGLHVYLSYNAGNPRDVSLRKWASNVLDHFPGVQVTAMERKPKAPPECPLCHQVVDPCPHCHGSMVGTVEKGIDTAIVTDMIRLAWENSYDVAVLVSADRDFIPAVEFLGKKGVKIVNACFPPKGSDLAAKCWANFSLKSQPPPQRQPQRTAT